MHIIWFTLKNIIQFTLGTSFVNELFAIVTVGELVVRSADVTFLAIIGGAALTVRVAVLLDVARVALKCAQHTVPFHTIHKL